MKYSEVQLEAVRHMDGPMMVLAGPGSGKTTVITGRVKNLIDRGIQEDSILVITFTKAAAIEMRERFVNFIKKDTKVRFATFHSFFYSILRVSFGYKATSIITNNISDRFFKNCISELRLNIGNTSEVIKNINTEISLVKSNDIDIDNYYSSKLPYEDFRKIYKAYEAYLRKNNLIDFDDMMLICKKVFIKNPKILSMWQNKYKYILIDEFQDVSKIQFDLIIKIAAPQNNIFIVGDDDQSIYRFRGARPEIMLGFEKFYPNCKKVILNENYRSTVSIVNFAGKIISKNTKRFNKDIKSGRNVAGVSPEIWIFKNRIDEDYAIIKSINDAKNSGIPLSEIAVVYRVNSAIRPILRRFNEYKIPYNIKDGLYNIYNHFISKQVIDYLEVAGGSREPEKIMNIMNAPLRKFRRDELLNCIEIDKSSNKVVSFIKWRGLYKNDTRKYRLDDFIGDIKKLGGLKLDDALAYIRNKIGYDKYLVEYAKKLGIDCEELFEVLEELNENFMELKTLPKLREDIERAKKETVVSKDLTEKDAVTISTMHTCKGLEFKRVYVAEAVEGLIPYKLSKKKEEIEEERRLFYVAVTRAKDELIITVPKYLFRKKREPSRFIEEFFRRKHERRADCMY